METTQGDVVIEIFPDLAPLHIRQIYALIHQKFYDGLTFHRVIDGFMAQTGCPNGTGSGGLEQLLAAEFSEEPHKRGICSMARSTDPDSASCQFFICLDDYPSLDGQYSVWGKVIKGMENVDKIKKGDPANNGLVENPDKIISMKLASAVPVNYKP